MTRYEDSGWPGGLWGLGADSSQSGVEAHLGADSSQSGFGVTLPNLPDPYLTLIPILP